jgi:hypothetical protein
MPTRLVRAIVVMKLPIVVVLLLKFAAALAAALTNNAFFPNAAAIVAAITKAITALDAAETATKTRVPGTVAARNTAHAALVTALHAAKAYIQQAADADPEHAEAMITSTGLLLRRPVARTKAPFAVKQGSTTGKVHLVARAAAVRASYEWQWSSDGGKTWLLLPVTLKASTTLEGVPAGTNAMFRFRSVTKAGESDWSQPVSLLVK